MPVSEVRCSAGFYSKTEEARDTNTKDIVCSCPEGLMDRETNVMAAKNDRKFEVRWDAGDAGHLHVRTDSLSVHIGQRVRRNGIEEIWDSVGVYGQEEEDGTLVVRVLVFNPDWDEPLQIACIRSRPGDAASLTPLGCNLNHVTESESTRRVQPQQRPFVARDLRRLR